MRTRLLQCLYHFVRRERSAAYWSFSSTMLIERYEAKQAEIAAACSLLCAEPGCRIIISKEKTIQKVGLCPGCNRGTCAKCRTAQHEGKECPTDEEHQELLELAKEKGWQSCYQCNYMIELNFGCNHTT